MMQLIEKIDDLIKQATTERSHYYVASILKECKAALSDAETVERERDSADERARMLNFQKEKLEAALAAAQGEVDMLREYITPNEGECQIGKEPWPDQCCCRCKYLLIDYWHCTRMPEEMKESDHCGCEKVRGYICIAGEIHGDKSGNSGWPHHSKGCECFTKREIAADALNGGKP